MVLISVGIGIAVLARMGGGHGTAAASTTTVPPTVAAGTTTTSTVTGTSAATTTTTVPPGNVTVLVLNGATTEHAALYFETKLHEAGYDTQAPNDATSDTNALTHVFVFEPAAHYNALAIATALGVPSAAVVTPSVANDSAIPSADLHTSDIVVVVGADISKQVPPNYAVTTVPPAATTTGPAATTTAAVATTTVPVTSTTVAG